MCNVSIGPMYRPSTEFVRSLEWTRVSRHWHRQWVMSLLAQPIKDANDNTRQPHRLRRANYSQPRTSSVTWKPDPSRYHLQNRLPLFKPTCLNRRSGTTDTRCCRRRRRTTDRVTTKQSFVPPSSGNSNAPQATPAITRHHPPDNVVPTVKPIIVRRKETHSRRRQHGAWNGRA